MELFMLGIAGFFTLLFGIRHSETKSRNKRIVAANKYTPDANYASARFAETADCKRAGLFNGKGLFFGFSPDGLHRLFYQKTGHMLIVCAARGGKLYTVLVSLIFRLGELYALLLVDPKLEMTPIVAKARAKCGPLFVWNAYNLHPDHLEAKGYPPSRFNPMLDIDPDARTCQSDCRKLMSTMWDEPSGREDGHWLPSALDLATAITYTLLRYGKPEERNLPAVRTVLTGGNGHSVFEFAREAMTIDDNYVKQQFGRYAEDGADKLRELISIISTAITQTSFLSNPAIAESLMEADFSFMDMKRTPGMTVAVGLPLNRMDDKKCFSMLSGWMLHCALEQGAKGHRVPCVAVLDEMSFIGHSKAWQDAFANAAGAAGLQIVAVYQDLSQILEQFGKAAQTVIQNCGISVWFRVNDTATRAKVAEMAGVREVMNPGRTMSIDHMTGEPHVSDSKSMSSVPLIHPHEVGALDDDEAIAFCEGVLCGPIKIIRKPYIEIESGYGENPYYPKKGFWG